MTDQTVMRYSLVGSIDTTSPTCVELTLLAVYFMYVPETSSTSELHKIIK
jgi:hypothetical protein